MKILNFYLLGCMVFLSLSCSKDKDSNNDISPNSNLTLCERLELTSSELKFKTNSRALTSTISAITYNGSGQVVGFNFEITCSNSSEYYSGNVRNIEYDSNGLLSSYEATINGEDCTYGETPYTDIFPDIYMLPETNLTQTAVTLNAVVNANGSTFAVFFEYGATLSYGNIVNAVPTEFSGDTDTEVSLNISGLTPNTTYHYRLIVSNAELRLRGTDATFTTAAK